MGRLREEFAREGRFDPNRSEIVYRVGEVVLMHVVGAYLVLATGYAASGITLMGLAQGRCGWLMHEGGHYSMTGNIQTDRVLQLLIYGIGCGMSGAWWRNQHNKHHATPQKLQHDVDLDTLPLVAFHAKIAARARSPLVKLWLRLQCYLFIPVSCLLVASGWQLYLHPRHALRTKRKREFGVHGPPLRPALRRRVEGHGPPRLGVPGVQPGRRELHLHELLAESYPLAGHRGGRVRALGRVRREAHHEHLAQPPVQLVDGQPELPGRAPPLPGDAPVPAQAHLAARAGVLRGPRPGVRRAALLLVPAADAREPARRRPLHEGRLMRRFPRLVSRRSTGPNEPPVL